MLGMGGRPPHRRLFSNCHQDFKSALRFDSSLLELCHAWLSKAHRKSTTRLHLTLVGSARGKPKPNLGDILSAQWMGVI